MKVAYLGTKGSFSEMAAVKYFGKDAKTAGFSDFKSMFDAVENDADCCAVLPVENTTTGMITRTYDLFQYHDVFAFGEVNVPIRECLITVPGAKLEDIKNVYSHPEALSQCNGFFSEHPSFKPVVYSNTAAAVEYVKSENDPSKAALASELAAEYFGLPILLRQVQDNKNNITRFLCVAKDGRAEEGANKISIMLKLRHDPGALFRALGVLAARGINLLMIQSRPVPGEIFDYCFYLDFEGNLGDANVAEAIRRLEYDCEAVKIIGNYRADVV